jgi:hypothetical protein
MLTSLSILIYLAEIVDSVTLAFFWLGLAALVVGILWLWWYLTPDTEYQSDFKINQSAVKRCVLVICSGVIAMFLSACVPTKQCMYMMSGLAAVEYWPNVESNNPECVKIIKDISVIIRRYSVGVEP